MAGNWDTWIARVKELSDEETIVERSWRRYFYSGKSPEQAIAKRSENHLAYHRKYMLKKRKEAKAALAEYPRPEYTAEDKLREIYGARRHGGLQS